MITPDNLPLILTPIANLLISLCWPTIVLLGLFLFRKEIRGLLSRLRAAKLPGGTEALWKFDDLEDKSIPEIKSNSQENLKIGDLKYIKWENSGNLYWLGHDLMWTMDALLRERERAVIITGLRQSLHHARSLGFSQTPFDIRLDKLRIDAENSLLDDWTLEKRLSFVKELRVIRKELGDLIASHQTNYVAKAKGTDFNSQ